MSPTSVQYGDRNGKDACDGLLYLASLYQMIQKIYLFCIECADFGSSEKGFHNEKFLKIFV